MFPRGAPGQDLGYAHTLKHWMNPQEMWEDISGEVPEHARPKAQWESWTARGVDPVAEARKPGATLTALWSELDPAWQSGYAATVITLAAPHAEPPGSWVRHGERGRWMLDAGDGVLIVVQTSKDEWALYTAYRAADFRLTDYRCPPRDAASVSLRKTLAKNAARKRVAALRGQGSDA